MKNDKVKQKWVLILNQSHSTKEFSSLARLRRYARNNALAIKKSFTAERTYYTDAFGYVPAK